MLSSICASLLLLQDFATALAAPEAPGAEPATSALASREAPVVGEFESFFRDSTLRWDYHHLGSAGEEHIATRGWRVEGAWAGSRTQLVDTTNLGQYQVRMVDLATQRLIYSRGFASIYGEWKTTAEAKRKWRAFEECVRVPEPLAATQLVLLERQADGSFRELHAELFEPGSRFVDRSSLADAGELFVLAENGPAATRVDLLVIAEGYTAEQRTAFEADLTRLSAVLFATEPFRARTRDFNLRGLFVPSAEQGLSNPRKDAWRASALGASFNSLDSDRYVLTLEDRRLREIAARAPYDALILLCKERKYGGGGIFNLWSTCTADSSEAAYLFVHEFGHSFAGLADEYYSSQVSYEEFTPAGSEPWEPNVTALLDPAQLKWRDLVAATTPLPTPWDQARFDAIDVEIQKKRAALIAARAGEEQAEALYREAREATSPVLGAEPYFGQIGAFEGAAYRAKGLYRSEVDCIMFTRNPTRFCRVCERAIERVIDLHAR